MLEEKKKTHEKLAFIHQVLTQRTEYYIEEFEIAKDAATMITNMANELADQIKEQMVSDMANEVSNEVDA